MTTIKLKNGSGAPTAGDLAQGEPALDLTNKRLYTEDSGGTVIEVGTNPSSVTTGDITATGTATFAGLTTTADVSFGDNDKAIFGAGSDLQIYHSGTDSRIVDGGTGSLFIGGDSFVDIGNSTLSLTRAKFSDSTSALYQQGNIKLATTSTGIDVTGTAVTDGLTSAGDAAITGGSSGSTVLTLTSNALADTPLMVFQRTGGAVAGKLAYEDSNTAMSFGTTTAHELKFLTSNTERMQIDSNGNVDIGAGENGTHRIGRLTVDYLSNSNPVLSSDGTQIAFTDEIALRGVGIRKVTTSPSHLNIIQDRTGYDIVFQTSPTTNAVNEEAMRIDSSGSVGINNTVASTINSSSGLGNLVVGSGSGNEGITIYTGSSSYGGLNFADATSGGGSYAGYIKFDHSDNSFGHFIGNTERMRIDSSGNVGIGESNPQFNLHIKGSGDTGIQLTKDGVIASRVSAVTSGLSFGVDGANGTTERMRIDSSGNVGIGTSSPSAPLHVGKSGAAAELWLQRIDGYNPVKLFGSTLGDGQGFKINVNSNDAFAIDSSGNVGIGTSSPSAFLSFGANIPSNGQTLHTYHSGNIRSGLGIVSGVHRLFTDSGSALSFGQVSTSDGSTYAERMRIDSSGNVGIGSSSIAGGSLGVNHAVAGTYPKASGIGLGATSTAYTVASNGGTVSFTGGAGLYAENTASSGNPTNLVFWTNSTGTPAEAMRIDSSGNLLVGTTSNYSVSRMTLEYDSVSKFGLTLRDSGSSSTAAMLQFIKNGSVVGAINSTTTATTYVTSSDQRLKDNIVDAPSASDDIDAIQVRSFDWKADGSHQKYGMVAQELQGVAPEAVSGDADSEEMMGVDYSKLVPMLVKEIQSLRARVAQLETN